MISLPEVKENEEFDNLMDRIKIVKASSIRHYMLMGN